MNIIDLNSSYSVIFYNFRIISSTMEPYKTTDFSHSIRKNIETKAK